MALMKDLRKTDNQTIRAAIAAGAACRRFIDNEGENDLWIVYESDAPTAPAIAAVNADRLVKLLLRESTTAEFLPGEAIVSRREVGDTVADTVDRRLLKLQARADKAAEHAASTAAALAAHATP